MSLHSLFLMVVTITLTFFTMISRSFANTPDRFDEWSTLVARTCNFEKNDISALRCINQETEKVIRQQVNDMYREQFLRFIDREGINGFSLDKINNIFDYFPVSTPLTNEFNRSGSCVDLGSEMGIRRIRKLKQLANAIFETSLFASRFSMFSLGRPFSPILNFHSIHVCQSSKCILKLNREQRVLWVGFEFNTLKSDITQSLGLEEVKVFNAELLWDTWQKGDALNPRPNNTRGLVKQVFEKINHIGLTPSEMIDEAIYQKWAKLNPTGDIRKGIRLTAWKFVSDLARDATSNPSEFVKGLIGKFAKQDQAELQKRILMSPDSLVEAINAKMMAPSFIEMGVTKHLASAENSCQGGTAHTLTQRKASGFFVFANSKTVVVSVDFNFPFGRFDQLSKDLYEKPDVACASSKVENYDQAEGVFVFNLVDNVSVSVIGLSKLTDALLVLPQMVLLEIIQSKPHVEHR